MKPNFLFIGNEKDYTARELFEETLALGYQAEFYLPHQLMHQEHPLPKLKVDENTVAMFFWPFVPNKIQSQYQSLISIILESHQFKYVFNEEMYRHSFLCYEDKLYQTYLFDKIGVPYAPLTAIGETSSIDYPIIAKKRVSSRSKNNYLLQNNSEFEVFKQKNDSSQYIFQKFYPLESDYRVIVFRDKVIGVVKRKVEIKENNRVTVRVVASAELPEEALEYARKVSRAFNCELSGVDVGLKKEGGYFIIEHNGRPQIGKSAKTLNKNLSAQIISEIAAGIV